MPTKNESIVLSKDEAIAILNEINVILISLHRIGSAYIGKPVSDYEHETCRFIDEWRVTHRLAEIRAILTQKFDLSLGDDDMNDLERVMENIKYWVKEEDLP